MQKNQDQRLTMREKNANKKEWYKNKADSIITSYGGNFESSWGEDDTSEYHRMQVNYNLFNDILDVEDFNYICKPFGEDTGQLPARMVNRDIVSSKIKALLGMEMKRPFSWSVTAVNPEATTRREQEETRLIKEYVNSQIMLPIRQQNEMAAQEEIQGKELTPEEQQEIAAKVEEQTKAMTPDEVKKYMVADHLDPSEALGNQLLNLLVEDLDIYVKFNNAFKHLNLGAKEVFYIGIENGKPVLEVINVKRFKSARTVDSVYIEDEEWAVHEYRLSRAQIVSKFSSELTQKEIDTIYDGVDSTPGSVNLDFSIREDSELEDGNTLSLYHCVWKSLRKIKFLTYLDEEEQVQTTIVDESYILNKDLGDISIKVEWIPECYEGYKVKDIYLSLQPIPGQFKDLNNLHTCKLPYYGVYCDNTNAQPTCIMDRLKKYQYYYNIIMYRIELLLASDKGKKILMNINAVPKAAGFDLKQWQYYFESSSVMWADPTEEGANSEVTNLAKVIDLSLISDIQKYIQLAEHIRRQAGISTGVTDQVEGQISANEAVGNTQQALIQTSHILEPYFLLHDTVKRNVLQGLLDVAKVAYTQNPEDVKLTYSLDDLTRHTLTVDQSLLDNNTLGLHVANSGKADRILQSIQGLMQAAMQNDKVNLSDTIAVLRQDSIVEAENTLKAAEVGRKEEVAQQQQAQHQNDMEMQEAQKKAEEEKFEQEKELVVLKEEERRKTVMLQSTLTAASFNPDQDVDNNGVNDFLELEKHGLDVKKQEDAVMLEREKLEQKRENDNKKLNLEEKKIKNQNKKS